MNECDLRDIEQVLDATELYWIFNPPAAPRACVDFADSMGDEIELGNPGRPQSTNPYSSHESHESYESYDPGVRARLHTSPAEGPPPWLIGMSKQFRKDTSGLDRRLQGRLLEVLTELSNYSPPFVTQGDTFKPLKGELEGCWRYRIGDHRLVVEPDARRCQLNALAFGARGSIYD